MITISFTDAEYDHLRDLVSHAYSSNYYHNKLDTGTFDTMADKIEGAYEKEEE